MYSTLANRNIKHVQEQYMYIKFIHVHCLFQRKKTGRSPAAPVPSKVIRMLMKLWDITVDYRDHTGRQIAGIFMVLPTRKELPEYYQIIRKPIDFKKIKVQILYH